MMQLKIPPCTGWPPSQKITWLEGATEDEMVEWHHRLNGHGFELTLGDSERQGSLACCSPWGHKESDTTEPQNNNANSTEVEKPCHKQLSHQEGIVKTDYRMLKKI